MRRSTLSCLLWLAKRSMYTHASLRNYTTINYALTLHRGQVQRALKKAEYNQANFGDSRKGRLCICEVPGQVPCPSRVPLGEVKHSWHDKKQESAV